MARLSSWWVARKTNAAKGKQDACSEGTRSPCSSVGSAAELPFEQDNPALLQQVDDWITTTVTTSGGETFELGSLSPSTTVRQVKLCLC